MSALEKPLLRLRPCFSPSKRDIRPHLWRQPKFWPSNITNYFDVGSSRWASTSHYERQQGRKKADHYPYFRATMPTKSLLGGMRCFTKVFHFGISGWR